MYSKGMKYWLAPCLVPQISRCTKSLSLIMFKLSASTMSSSTDINMH